MTTVAVFGSSAAAPSTPVYRDAERLGRLLAQRGFTVANGGYDGVMEAVSKGAAEAGGTVVAVTAPTVFPDRPGANGWVGTQHTVDTIAERIHRLVDMADAMVTMPGSLGTVTEFMVAWNDGFVNMKKDEAPKPHVAVGSQWPPLVKLLSDRFGADRSPLMFAPDVEVAVEMLAIALEDPGEIESL
jgi:uncharacterized protein (TIGR00730 family)